MIDIVPYTKEHLTQIELKSIHSGEVPNLIPAEAFTLIHEGKPIAIFGAFWFTSGVLHFWGLVSESVRKCPISFHKSCLKLRQFCEENHKPHRMQMEVRWHYKEGLEWAKSLGFECEGLMKNYGGQGDHYWILGRSC